MADPESSNAQRSPNVKRCARRILELITAAAFLIAILSILYSPTTNTGRLILVAAAVVWFVGLKFLFKWPSV
jgi:hypothetical protein